MMTPKVLNDKAEIYIIYAKRKEGGKRLISIEDYLHGSNGN